MSPTDWRDVSITELYRRVRIFAGVNGSCYLYLHGVTWQLHSTPKNEIAEDLVGAFNLHVSFREFAPPVLSTLLAMVRT